jgi:hypothetical protein
VEQHVDPDVLALVSLGEPVEDEAARRHLAGCAQCADEVAALSEVVAVGRSSAPGDTLVAPPPAVWARIRDELGLDPALTPGAAPRATADDDGAGTTTSPTPGTTGGGTSEDRGPGHVAPGSGGTVSTVVTEPGVAPVVPLRRRAPWVAAAAAAGLVVGGVGGAALMDRVRADAPAPVVAEVALDPLPGWSASGDAFVEQASDGTRTLVVTLEGGVDDGGFREVWLIDEDVTKLVSLGVLDGTEGRFSIPAGLDLAEFPVVDVSEEPFDGDPGHSGDSIIRGVLPA